MKKLTILILTSVVMSFLWNSCQPAEKKRAPYYLVTRLGADTLAVEQVIRLGDSIEAHVLLRSPKLRQMDFGFSKKQTASDLMRGVIRDGATGDLVSTYMARWDGDSLLVSRGDRQRKVSTDKNILPFIDMVHWSFDLMLENGQDLAVGEAMEQPLWSGTRTLTFEITRITADSMTVKHPSRGTMGVKTTKKGDLALLDAGETTRKLTVTRAENLDFEALRDHFIELEQAGKSLGALSGRGKAEKEINGIKFLIDYGRPEKRGRRIWGGIVKYGERWRTGANRATHFIVDKDIMLGNLAVPAGEYTLFSIPQESYLSLIINKQTGQNGQSYDDSLDLGVVDLAAVPLDDVVEIFTIDVVGRDGKAFLSLQWADKAYEVEIKY